MSSRRSISLFRVSEQQGLITHTPHFNSLFNFLNNPKTTPILHHLIAITSAPLRAIETDFAVDSTGFRTRCFGAYCEGKYPSAKEHIWLKLHAVCGVRTNIITAVKITDENGADNPQLIPLAKETADNGFDIEKLFADKGYLSRDNLEYIDRLGGTAFIPFKRNSNAKSKGSDIWRKMYFYFKMNQEEFLHNYSQRSNIESTFSAMKKKLGETLKSKNRVAQENELLCKVIAYNIMVLIQEMKELGIEPNFLSVSK
jgi:transposase